MNHEDILLRNNTGNKSKESLIDGFVIRNKEFEELFYNFQQTSDLNHKQHFLIIGQRGTGKTSLMYRLNYAIEDDSKLAETIIPIIFSEEQYFLSELTNVWENVAIHLEDHVGWVGLSRTIDDIIEQGGDYEYKVFSFLRNKLINEGKSLMLFIENINVLLGKFSLTELERFKAILENETVLRLIGSATSVDDGYINFENHFYSFFKIIYIDGLDKADCERLLLKIGDQFGQLERIKVVIDKHPGRVESLRRLTGGIPRTISYLFQIFLDNENGKAIKDLYVLIDTLSLLYKSQIDQLSVQQQRVIDVIARRWDAIPVKDIVKGTRLESKNISKIIAALEKDQLIEKVQTDTKNNLYRIKERFMNIWYLMRFGRKHDKENVIWLVRFFDTWCERKELDKMITAHIDNLKGGTYDINAAIDMGNTFLSCANVSDSRKQELLKATRSILPERLLNAVKWPSKDEQSTLADLIAQKKFTEAFALLENIEPKNGSYYTAASSLYFRMGDYAQSVEAAKKVLELDKSDARAALTIGILYEDFIKDTDLAKYYYNLSLSQNIDHPYAANRLGDIAFYKEHNTSAAINYHALAVKKIYWPSLLSLGRIYLKEGNYKKAENYLLQALHHNVKNVNVELGKLYAVIRDVKKAQLYFDKAVELNEPGALLEYGKWSQYKRKPDYTKAEELLRQAIARDDVDAYSYLGRLYLRKLNDKAKAFEVFKEGEEKGDAASVHQLAHLYLDRKDFEKSDALFLKANEMGDHLALLCFVSAIYRLSRSEKRHAALKILEDNLDKIDKTLGAEVLYAKILLWDGQLDKSLSAIKKLYPEIANLQHYLDNDSDDLRIESILYELMHYFELLLAKGEYQAAFKLFNEKEVDFKAILKPVYFVLMDILKKEYPLEYLKAGDEFKDTIKEIQTNINRLKKRI